MSLSAWLECIPGKIKVVRNDAVTVVQMESFGQLLQPVRDTQTFRGIKVGLGCSGMVLITMSWTRWMEVIRVGATHVTRFASRYRLEKALGPPGSVDSLIPAPR